MKMSTLLGMTEKMFDVGELEGSWAEEQKLYMKQNEALKFKMEALLKKAENSEPSDFRTMSESFQKIIDETDAQLMMQNKFLEISSGQEKFIDDFRAGFEDLLAKMKVQFEKDVEMMREASAQFHVNVREHVEMLGMKRKALVHN